MSAPASGGDSHGGGSGGDAIMKAVGIGFLALILINGQMSSSLQFAIIIAIIAYFVMTKPKKEAGH